MGKAMSRNRRRAKKSNDEVAAAPDDSKTTTTTKTSPEPSSTTTTATTTTATTTAPPSSSSSAAPVPSTAAAVVTESAAATTTATNHASAGTNHSTASSSSSSSSDDNDDDDDDDGHPHQTATTTAVAAPSGTMTTTTVAGVSVHPAGEEKKKETVKQSVGRQMKEAMDAFLQDLHLQGTGHWTRKAAAAIECIPQREHDDTRAARLKMAEENRQHYHYARRLPTSIATIDSEWYDVDVGVEIRPVLPAFLKITDMIMLSKEMRMNNRQLELFALNKAKVPANIAFGSFEQCIDAVVAHVPHFMTRFKEVEDQIDDERKQQQQQQQQQQQSPSSSSQQQPAQTQTQEEHHHHHHHQHQHHHHNEKKMNVTEWLQRKYSYHQYVLFEKPEALLQHWMEDDAEFARQRLGGINPNAIARCRTMPEGLSFTADNDGVELQQRLLSLLAANNLFVTDFRPVLRHLKHVRKGKHLCVDTVGFFAVEEKKEEGGKVLLPVAIQLHRDGPWFTPHDPPNMWLFAKMHYQSADAHVHQFATHFGNAHGFVEPFVIAAQRQLSPHHPLFLVLQAHSRGTLVINTIGRLDMFRKGGMVDAAMSAGRIGGHEIISGSYQNFHLSSLPTMMEKAGMTAAEFPCSYPYRDDALLIDAAIRKFTFALVAVYYDTDEEVLEDEELTRYFDEVMEHAGHDVNIDYESNMHYPESTHPDSGSGDSAETKKKKQEEKRVNTSNAHFNLPKTREEVATFLADIIFIATVQHSLVNYMQFDYYSFVPNAPLYLNHPPPMTKHKNDGGDAQQQQPWDVSADTIFTSLPDSRTTLGQIAFAHLLSLTTPETMLRVPPTVLYSHLLNDKAKKACKDYEDDLKAAREKIVAQRKARVDAFLAARGGAHPVVPKTVEYPYCDPLDYLAISIQL